MLKLAAKKNTPCKWDETMEKGHRSPKKENQRTHGGKRVSSTGLAGAIKRRANNAVHWKREIIELEAHIADLDLPRNNPRHGGSGRVKKNPLFGQLTKARAKLDGWTDKLRRSEMDMRNGAWRKFDIDEAIITSDRRKAEQAAKNPVPDGEEPGA
jgi:hypothetical protein